MTLGIAQSVHEYCNCLAIETHKNNWTGSMDSLKIADIKWIKIGLRSSYVKIENLINETRIEKNLFMKLLYALSSVNSLNFNAEYIWDKLKKHFPRTVNLSVSDVSNYLSDLSNQKNAIIKRTIRDCYYRFIDPRHLMLLKTFIKWQRKSEKAYFLILKT